MKTSSPHQVLLDTVSDVFARPFLKWAGGKRQLIDQLSGLFPVGLRTGEIKKYAEPFVGGGALFFFIVRTYPKIESYFISDVNKELILTYRTIKQKVDGLVSYLYNLEKNYLARDQEKREAFFYETRNDFNEELRNIDFYNYQDSWIERAAITIFLNRTCFNGLFRVNSKGEFNVPFGRYKNPKICDAENLFATSNVLQKTEIRLGDFTDSKDFIDKDTFVYFDPPYRPISQTSNFTSYSKGKFNDDDQRRLAEYYRMLDETKGASLMLSNSDPNDSFFENLYNGFIIRRVNATRRINSKGDGRGEVKELLITNYFGDEK